MPPILNRLNIYTYSFIGSKQSSRLRLNFNTQVKVVRNVNFKISLLPISSKIFEKIMFNSLFKYLEDNKLLNCYQSGFRHGDSYVHQLFSITHKIYKSFDANLSLEVRGAFFEIFKTFDQVWHNGLLHTLKLSGICSRYYKLIQPFLNSRYQSVVLNGQSSK